MANLYKICVFVQLKDGDDYIRWSLFCKYNNYDQVTLKSMTGTNSIQQLFTKWCRRASHEEVVNYSQEISTKTTENGFNVIRTRIECHWSIPRLISLYYECVFNINIRSIDEFNKLCSTLQDEQGVSICSLNKCICVSIRPFIHTLYDVIAHKDRIINRLKSQDFHISGRIMENQIVFDTNMNLDENRFL